MGKIRETRELKQCIEIWEEKDIIIKKPEKKETRKHSWNVNLINITFLYLYPMTHCVFVSNGNSELKWPECWPSRTSWIATGSSMFLLMERFCLTQRILLPSTVEFDESEHWKTENIHFRFPFLTSWTSTFSLFKVPIAIGWVKPGGSTIYLCSKPEVYGNPINVSDGYLVYTWSDK